MKLNRRMLLSVSMMVACGLVVLPHVAGAQQKPLKEQIVGTWTLVSSDTINYGSRYPTFGANPKGIAVFDAGGRYVFNFVSSNLPKFAGNSRTGGTADENKAIVEGTLSHFGTYTVNEADRSFTLRIEGSSYPNWAGTEQKRSFMVTGDDLTWTTPEASGGGSAELAWKRAR